MVSISNALTLALIGGGILAFYKLGGAGGIGSRIGGGFSTLFDSFTNALSFSTQDKSALDYNPALDPLLVSQMRLEEATTEDPNLAADRFVDPAGNYDPFADNRVNEDEATTVNTGGFIQGGEDQNMQLPFNAGSLEYIFGGNSGGGGSSSGGTWSGLSGVNITGSYTSQAIPNYSKTTLDHSQNNNSGGSGGNSTGGSSGGNSGGSGSSSRGSSSGGSSSGGSSSGGGGSSSGGGGNSGGSSGGSTGGSSGTSSRGGQGAGRSSSRGR